MIFRNRVYIANIFFILILVFIGLATILRIQTYQFQKTLPVFIGVALLINFSGVLVGFFADIGNIIANFFLTASVKETGWFTDWPGAARGSGLLSIVASSLAKIVYYSVASIIYFVVFLVFFVRVFVLWVLAILAPLAFALYILPGTKKYWTQWWTQLIQWSFLIIPIGFTLLLSSMALTGISGEVASGADPGPLAAFMGPFSALFILFAGISLATQMAPAGASAVIAKGKQWGTGIGKFAGKKAMGFARDRITESPKGRAFLDRMNKLSTTPSLTWGEKMSWTDPRKWGLRSLTTAISTIQRAPGTAVNALVVQADKKVFSEYKAKAAKNDSVTNRRAFREAPNMTAKAGIYAGMSKQHRKDLSDKEISGEGNVATEGEMELVYTKANVLGEEEVVEAIERSLVNDETMIDLLASMKTEFMKPSERSTIKGLTKDEEKEGMRSFTDKIIADVKSADDAKQLGKGLDKNEEAVKAMHKFWGGPQFSAAINEHGRKLSDKIDETKLTEDEYLAVDPATGKQFNPKAATYFASTAAQGLGLSAAGTRDPKGLAKESKKKRDAYKATLPGAIRDLPVIDTELATKRTTKASLAPGTPGHARLDAEIKKLTEEHDETEYLENNIIQAAIRMNTTSKPDADIRKEVLEEYEKKYRSPILRQVQREAPLVTWLAANNPAAPGDERVAWNDRFKELYERARGREELSYSNSKDFYLDEKQKKRSAEAAIGDMAKVFTPAFDEAKRSGTARSLAGLHQAVSSLIEETEREINETTDPTIRGNATKKLQEYKQRENNIRTALKSIPRKDRSFKKP